MNVLNIEKYKFLISEEERFEINDKRKILQISKETEN